LLLHTNGLGMEHLVVTYPPSGPVGEVLGLPGPANRGYITVVGTEEDTEVEIIPTQDIVAGTGVSDLGGGVGITAGTSRSFTLGPYDVLNLETTLVTDLFSTPENFADLTGSIVNSTAPVAVFTGADLAMITSGFSDSPCCAEHLEQQVLPTRVMRNQFVVSHSAQRNSGDTEPDLVRIMALEAGTSVTTSLDAPDNSFTLGAGEYRELWPTSGFTVDATGPLHVAQFLIVGGDVPSPIAGAGDSSLLYVPPVLQRKNDYVFTTGEGFQSNWAVISMPEGITASLDGAELSTLSGCSGPEPEGSLGTTGYEAWTCSITDGVHRIWSGAGADPGAENIGVLVYGYYAAGSYSYPAGAGLQ
ncbi:MAG TPA: hypothetical protein DIU15_11415, partial [Deltaproteobacteria bacterium]|nr:hypothetical protein [Deltaproteobacteria bacterium]